MSRFYRRLLFVEIPMLVAVGVLPHMRGQVVLFACFVLVALSSWQKWQLGDFHD